MKHLFFAAFLLLSTLGFTQTTNDFQVTLNGIGPFKINMKKTDVEKVLNQNIVLPAKGKKDDYGNDTAKVTYKGVELTIVFYQNYIDENDSETAVFSISSNSSLLKTKSGIVTGDDKMKIITTYNDFDFNFYYNYEQVGNDDYKRSKSRSTIMLMGENSPSVLYFNLNEGKLESFEVAVYEGC